MMGFSGVEGTEESFESGHEGQHGSSCQMVKVALGLVGFIPNQRDEGLAGSIAVCWRAPRIRVCMSSMFTPMCLSLQASGLVERIRLIEVLRPVA